MRGVRKGRRRDVNRFLEIRAFERVRFIENSQEAQNTFSEQRFDGDFPSWQIFFDDHLIEVGLASGANFGGIEQTLQAGSAGEEFIAIVGANDSLAGGKRKRLEYARIRNSEERGFGEWLERNRAEPRAGQTCIAEDFAGAEFAAAGFDAGGMVVRECEGAGNIGSAGSGTVSESEDAVNGQAALGFEYAGSGNLRRFEMRGECEVVPGVVQLMAAIGDEDELYAEFFSGGIERARLIAEFGSEEDESFWASHGGKKGF